MRWAEALLFVLSGATLVAQAPARDRASTVPPTGSSVIRGRIVAASTGDPLRHAVVRISGGAATIGPTLSDQEGRFQFATLPGGAYTVSATKPGFGKASVPVDVPARETIEAGDIALAKGAVLTGVMLDAKGEPIPFASVMALRVIPKPDGSVRLAVVATTTTDDSGAFRFGSLAADTYVVNPTLLANGAYFSSQPDAEFAPQLGRVRMPDTPRLTVQAGEERSGITLFGVNDRSALGPTPAPAVIDPRTAIVVRGRITRAGGVAAPRAIVQLLPIVPAPPLLTQADDSGHYELIAPNRPEGDYRVAARKDGYGLTEYGAQGPNRRGELLHFQPGDVRDNLDFALTKLSTISGRILDDFGEAVEGALVRVAQLRYVDGQRKLVEQGYLSLRTDDLGRYRIFGLRPGQYAIVASVGQVVVTESAAEFPGYGTTYFPGTTNASEIQLLSVGPAQEVNDLDFRLVREKTFRVAGHAADNAGEPVSGGISLTPRRRSGSLAAVQLGARIDKAGGFEFLNVAPGEYVLQVARGMGRNTFSEGEFAYRFIDIVDADVEDLEVQTGIGSTITGRVTVDGTATPPLDRLELSAMPVDLDRTPNGRTARARINAEDGTFELARIHGPRRLQIQGPPGWTLKAVIVNGIDVTDEPLPFGREDQSLEDVEVLVTNRAPRLAGRIAEARDLTMTDLAALVFSQRRDQWYLNSRYIRRTVVRSDGSFSFEGLPPGEYYLLAGYPPDDPGEWRDPELLEKLALQATRARLSEGQQVSVDLRVR